MQEFDALTQSDRRRHEKLYGSGYSLGLTAEELSTEACVLCVADIYDALAAKRPYRKRQLNLD